MRRPALLPLLALAIAALAALGAWINQDISPDLARLERILALLERDAEILWRQRPRLATTFEGSVVRTDDAGFRQAPPPANAAPDAASARVVCLGASPTFGYGVAAEEAYPKQAEAGLREAGHAVEVFNAGQIGYSSWQGLRLFDRHMDSWSPRIAVLSYVVNDVDRWRFFGSDGRSDSETIPPAAAWVSVENALGRLPPVRWLIGQRNRLLAKLTSGHFLRARYEAARPRSRPEDYEHNLRRFVKLCQDREVTPVFLLLPFHLPETVPPPAPSLASDLDRLGAMIEQGDLVEAARRTDALIASDPYGGRPYYLRGRIEEAFGHQDRAEENYDKAIQSTIHDCVRDAHRYNEIMAAVARETGTTLLDARPLLGAQVANMALYLPGDYIHPNEEGHRRLGQCLAGLLARLLGGQLDRDVVLCE